MVLVLDCSLLAHLTWERMGSAQYQGESDIEIEEFSRNYAELIFYFRHRFPDAMMIFAMDAPKQTYWRMPYLKDYYEGIIETFYNKTDKSYILSYNKAFFHLTYHEESSKWYQTKLTKDEYNEISSDFKKILGVPEELHGFFPKYKKRISSWHYETPYDVFKKMSKAISKNLARTCGGKAILVKHAEADDIAYVVSTMYPADNIVYVTNDSDWRQIAIGHLFAHFIDPKNKREFVPLDATQARYDLWVKIIAGDKSDTIPGIALKGKTQLIGKVRAENLVREIGVKDIGKYMKRHAEPEMLKRNLTMIWLTKSPDWLKEKIRIAIEMQTAYKPPLEWEDYGIKGTKQIQLTEEAESDARLFPVPG